MNQDETGIDEGGVCPTNRRKSSGSYMFGYGQRFNNNEPVSEIKINPIINENIKKVKLFHKNQ